MRSPFAGLLALVLACCAAPLQVAVAGDYALPLGVPDPAWQSAVHPINSAPPHAPAAWPSTAVAGYYYVNSEHAAATDANNPFGCPEKPRATIPSDLGAGAYVAVARCSQTTVLTALGTAEKPVWVVGVGEATVQPRSVGGFLTVSGSTFLIVDGLTFDGTGAPDTSASSAWAVVDGSHHVCIRNCNVRNMPAPPYNPTRFTSGGAGAWYHGLTSISPRNGPVSHVVIFGCSWIGNAGGRGLDYESGRHCIISAGNTSEAHAVESVWILNNTMHDNPEDGIQLGQTTSNADATLCRFFYIAGNTISSNGENAIDLKACDHVVVSQNVMHGYRGTTYRTGAVSGSDGTACVINDDGRGPLHSWWLFNTIWNARCAFRNQASTGEHYLIGNLIHDLDADLTKGEPTTAGKSGGVGYWQSSGASAYLALNTFYRVHGGIYMANVAHISMHGNIVCNLFDHRAGWPVNINNRASQSVGGNLYYDPDGPVRQDDDALDRSDLLNTDPQILETVGNGVELKTSSVLLTSPVSIAEYKTAYFAAFGTPFPLAFDTVRTPGTDVRWLKESSVLVMPTKPRVRSPRP